MAVGVRHMLAVVCLGSLLSQGCLWGPHVGNEARDRERCANLIARSGDSRLAEFRKDPNFGIPFALRLLDGRWLCGVKTSKGIAAVLICSDGAVLRIEPRVLWGPRGYRGPLVARLRPANKHEQVVLCVPEDLLSYVIDLKILDWDGRSLTVRTVTRFTPGYVQGGKPYGIIPALLRVGLDYDQILLLRKSADPDEPPEVAELVTWDEDTASFKVKRFQKVLVESQDRERLEEFIRSYREAVKESSPNEDKEDNSEAPCGDVPAE